jgi:DNA-binding NtrC family response regulator
MLKRAEEAADHRYASPRNHVDLGTGSEPVDAGRLTLALVWSACDWRRLGEVLGVAADPDAPPIVVGGGDAVSGLRGASPLLVRERPGRIESRELVVPPGLRRLGMSLRRRSADAIDVRQIGELALLHNGRASLAFDLREGDVLQVAEQLMFLCVRRPRGWTARAADAAFPFGEADPHGLVGESPAVWLLRAQVAFAAQRSEHVLVTGASGTGKELVAQAIHHLSSRGNRALVARNAATFPEGLIDAELFGNARNYPNPGMPERPGLIGQANDTTLFLDEIAELPRGLQAHLLRVLDGGDYQRLGEARARRSTLRLIGATNRPLSALKFDVAARLPLRIEVADLNGRREDIPLLARYLLRRLRGSAPPDLGEAGGSLGRDVSISCRFMRHLVLHHYTTNVRELEAFLLEALSQRAGAVLDLEQTAVFRRLSRPGAPGQRRDIAAHGPGWPRATVSPAEAQRCLDRNGGSVELSWRALGLNSRHVLARLVSKHRLRAGRSWRPPPDLT